jgi:hypothetical protein
MRFVLDNSRLTQRATVPVHPTSQFGQQATWNIITSETISTSTRPSSTTMDPIQKAIGDIELREEGASFSYREVAKRWGCNRTTLLQRHQGLQRPREEEVRQHQQLLNPQQEHEFVLYIERSTRLGLPPTQEMIQNFAGTVVKWEVSESLVTQFLHCHANKLTIKWSPGIDCNRHQADSEERYKLYFDLLHSKMREYNVDARNTYNMDEKGFLVSITTRLKLIFTKAIWASKERTAAVQDGNREWIILLACVCASGDSLPLALVYQSSSGLQSGWVTVLRAENTRFSSQTHLQNRVIMI